MSAVPGVEKKLNEIFVENKSIPALPDGVKKFIVTYLPWFTLIIGVLTLFAALSLWQWAHVANNLIDYANSVSATYGGTQISTSRMSIMLWAGLVVLLVEAILYIAAFPGTRAKKKSGWDLLFYAAIINILYGLILLFTDYGGIGQFIFNLIFAAIGLYFLFQIRASYKTGATKAANTAPAAPDKK